MEQMYITDLKSSKSNLEDKCQNLREIEENISEAFYSHHDYDYPEINNFNGDKYNDEHKLVHVLYFYGELAKKKIKFDFTFPKDTIGLEKLKDLIKVCNKISHNEQLAEGEIEKFTDDVKIFYDNTVRIAYDSDDFDYNSDESEVE